MTQTIYEDVGFIGCGAIGRCILSGLCNTNAAAVKRIVVCNRTAASTERLCSEYGVHGAQTAQEVVAQCRTIVLGVKPQQINDVLDSIRDTVNVQRHVIVSLAAGVTIASMARHLPHGAKIVRAMPNLPTRVNCGVTALCGNAQVQPDELTRVEELFADVGHTFVVREQDMHAVIAVAGSAPAYAFLFAEALCDGAVLGGLSQEQARAMAVHTLYGAARMMEEASETPSQLKDAVCSPGGTTIEAVQQLERGGMRSTIIQAMAACMAKSRSLERANE